MKFGFTLVTLYRLREENEYVPPVMDGVLSQPETVHVQVAYTSLQLLGELNEWLASHPTLLPQVLTFLIKKLQGNRDLATVAAKVSNLFYIKVTQVMK